MTGKRKITGPVVLGLEEHEFEVTIEVRNKQTGGISRLMFPNVEGLQTEAGTDGLYMMAVKFAPMPLTGDATEAVSFHKEDLRGGALGERPVTDDVESLIPTDEKGKF